MERTDVSTESDAPNDAPDAPEADETPEAGEIPEAGDAPDLPTVAGALSRCVREALERGEPTEVPGLGAFRVEHRSSQMEEPEEGGFSISPPRDEIVFEPAEE